MKNLVLIFSVLLMAGCQTPDQWQVQSPDGRIAVTVNQNKEADNELTYSVRYLENDEEVIKSSRLGIIREDAAFANNLSFLNSETQLNHLHDYTMIKGKQLENSVHSNRMVLSFENENKKPLNLVFEVFNEGIGFKYEFPDSSDRIHTVVEELTEFAMPEGNAWIQPYDTLNTWSPAYEYGYSEKMAIGTEPPLTTGWGFPALFEADGAWALVTETGLDGSYCGSHLAADCSGGIYQVEYPFEWENYGHWEADPKSTLPWETPWRIVIIGSDQGDIVESNLVMHLAEPQRIEDASWIEPGISSWNWWGDHEGGKKYNSLKNFVDFSREMGWKYSLVDADWHIMEGGSLEQLADYAENKGIGLLIWYNSGGPHSRVMNAGPRDRMYDPEIRREEMDRIREMGIRGIKVDFFQGDKQGTMQYYIDIVEDAAEHHLLVNTHGCTIPRGWDRTFPNLITMEAVRGAELYGAGSYPAEAVRQNTVLPFTRNVLGSMDYTPVTFSDYVPENKHITTNAHELALSVIFESGVQHFADRARSYKQQPQPVIDFLKDVPVIWDDTYFVEGYPGEYTVLAREREGVFYVAGINGVMKERNVEFDLSFLEEDRDYDIRLIKDGENSRAFSFETLQMAGNEELDVSMLPGGGFAATVVPR